MPDQSNLVFIIEPIARQFARVSRTRSHEPKPLRLLRYGEPSTCALPSYIWIVYKTSCRAGYTHVCVNSES